jgi:hypothetical protein
MHTEELVDEVVEAAYESAAVVARGL